MMDENNERRIKMVIIVNERKILQERKGRKDYGFANCKPMFDITLWRSLGESKEEMNKKGKEFRDDVNKLKVKNTQVGRFMPMPDTAYYAFFIVICSPWGVERMRKKINTIVEKKNIKKFLW